MKGKLCINSYIVQGSREGVEVSMSLFVDGSIGGRVMCDTLGLARVDM